MRALPVALFLLAACGGSSSRGGSSGTSGSGGGASSSSGSGSSSGSSGSSGSTGALTDTFDPSRVYLVGTLDEHFCGQDLIAAPEAPSQVLFGLPCFDTNFRLRPDGKLLYLVTDANGNNSLRLFAQDALGGQDGGWLYPTTPLANDAVVPTPACDAEGGPTAYVVDPSDGGAIYNCGSASDWWDQAGAVRFSNVVLSALGPQGSALIFTGAQQLQVLDGAGAAHPVTLPFSLVDTVRGLPDGFWLATEDNGPRNLWRLDLGGGATDAGRYPDLPGGSATSRLDGSGNLYLFGPDPRDAGADALFRLAPGGAAPVLVYGELDAPPLDWSSSPPVLYPRLGPQGGHLFTGP